MKTILYVKGSDRSPSVLKCAGFARGARAHGWRVQTVTLPADRAPDLKRLVRFWKADAFVFDSGGFSKQPDLRAVRGLPSVFLTCRPASGERPFTVCEDLRATAECAARELLQLGCRHFGYVPFPNARYWSAERARHFRDVVRLNGGTCDEFGGGDKAASMDWNAALRRWLRARPRPCGVFAANDEVSNLVRGICASEGLKVPDDVAIVGVDNDEPICTGARPHLSSVLADNEQMGFLAAHLLAEQFRDPDFPPTAHVVPPLMVVRRDSSRRRAPADSRVSEAVALIREKACEGLRARDVLHALGGARRTAETHFREAVGRSILDEIQRVRLERARELLVDPSRPLKIVANLCGYASESAFRRIYRAHFGVPPRRDGLAARPAVHR